MKINIFVFLILITIINYSCNGSSNSNNITPNITTANQSFEVTVNNVKFKAEHNISFICFPDTAMGTLCAFTVSDTLNLGTDFAIRFHTKTVLKFPQEFTVLFDETHNAVNYVRLDSILGKNYKYISPKFDWNGSITFNITKVQGKAISGTLIGLFTNKITREIIKLENGKLENVIFTL